MYLITGGKGFLGQYIVNELKDKDIDHYTFHRKEYDLRDYNDCQRLFGRFSKIPDLKVINLAASVGGIGYNRKNPYKLFYDNLMINANVINSAISIGVEKFIQIGTTCSYPKFCPTPFSEFALWDGYPEETNAPYGIAKRASLAQLQAAHNEFNFNGIYVIPTNLYGPFDTFDPSKSHVIPALIKKFYDARDKKYDTVKLWGTGKASRDFLYVTDAAKGIIMAAEKYNNPKIPMNLGSGNQVKIMALSHHISRIVGYKGKIQWDNTMPDGQPKRQLDIKHAKDTIGWTPETKLIDGLTNTIRWYEDFRYG